MESANELLRWPLGGEYPIGDLISIRVNFHTTLEIFSAAGYGGTKLRLERVKSGVAKAAPPRRWKSKLAAQSEEVTALGDSHPPSSHSLPLMTESQSKE